ncbi:MAG TPA: FMN-binding protein [Gammaproteobacteria bacterium]|jgi:electron transport complex protein RnfG|nr:FMN-binding protein [Gammaproteobacteria bacterium]
MTEDKQPDVVETSSNRLVATLAVAGLISGVAIIAIYEATLPTITRNKARELQEAVFKVLPGVTRMQKLAYRNGELTVVTAPEKDDRLVYGGYDGNGAFLGYAIPGAGPGFQDTIGLLYGYEPERRLVVGMEILESRETPGLGDKIYKDAAFVANFEALAIDPEIVSVKKGKKVNPNEVDSITGATISSKAVVRIINETQATWAPRLPEPGAQPALAEPDEPGTREDGR